MSLQADSLTYLSAFLGGVLVSFSPCVYPLLPVTLSFIGVRAGSSPRKGLFLSLFYITGLAVTYSVFGLIASLTGKLFGQLSTHPVSFLVIANACIIAGLSFLGVFNLDFTAMRLADKIKGRGDFLSAFLLGVASGLVVGPCATPVLGTILVYVASRHNIAYGASLLFTFAFGMGFIFILAGMSGVLFLKLPKAGNWMAVVKKIGGLVLIGMGEYFLIKAGRLM